MGIDTVLYMYDVVVKTFTFAISSTDEFFYWEGEICPVLPTINYKTNPLHINLWFFSASTQTGTHAVILL